MGRELQRILALPVRVPWAGRALPPRTAAVASRLRPVQIEALAELETAAAPRGLFGEIGAGHGKTIPSILAGYVTGTPGDRVLLIVPPDLYSKTLRDLRTWSLRFPEAEGHWPEVLSSSTLSHPKHATAIFDRMPRLIVIDEAHQFADPTTARTRRLIEYFQQYPDTRLVVLSGTLSGKQIKRMAHLSELVLRDHSFLPRDNNTLDTWATVLDYGSEPAPGAVKYLEPLARLAPPLERPQRPLGAFAAAAGARTTGHDTEGIERVRRGYTQRRVSTPGVVATADSGVGVSLCFRAWRPSVPSEIHTALRELKEKWITPDGTELVSASDLHRHAITLSCGFCYRPIYRKAEEGPELDEWMNIRLEWGRALRRQLLYIQGYSGLDSPSLVIQACKEGRAHRDTIRAWEAWEAVENAIVVERETIWLTKSVLAQAVETVQKRDRAILWFSSTAIGEELERIGFPTFGAGTEQPSDRLSHVALSMHAHGTGKNLQAWAENLLIEPPLSEQLAEQVLARTHRPGQPADTVYVDMPEQTWATRAKLHTLRRKARYLEETGVQSQRLCYGTWT